MLPKFTLGYIYEVLTTHRNARNGVRGIIGQLLKNSLFGNYRNNEHFHFLSSLDQIWVYFKTQFRTREKIQFLDFQGI